MMTPVEEPIRFSAAGSELARQTSGGLAGILHHPASGRAIASVLVVHPFAEEQKFSHRVLVNLARELARRDVATLRFDLSGCGDSFGDSRDATLARWKEDIRSARALVETRFPEAPLVLMGLRLGATLALDLATESPQPAALVLWEPVISGAKYVDEILRRRMIKEMMTTGRKATGRDAVLRQLDASGAIDLDGIAVGRTLIEEISALDAETLAERFSASSPLKKSTKPFDVAQAPPPVRSSAQPRAAGPHFQRAARVLCVQIAYNAKPSSALDRLAKKFSAAGADVRTVGIREQTLWDRVELVEARELIDSTATWIATSALAP
jgi:exosortase A-associated hydrolase 2